MSRILLCCSSSVDIRTTYSQIWSVGRLIELGLAARGIHSRNLFDIKLADIDSQLRESIEIGLDFESLKGGINTWSSLAFQHVFWRFVRYYQYRLRIESLIKIERVERITVSSALDIDLVHACKAACKTHDAQYVILDGPCRDHSSMLSFLAAYDLPYNKTFFDVLTRKTLATIYRLRGTKIFYQPYSNLKIDYPDTDKLTWRRSLNLSGLCLPNLSPSHRHGIVNLQSSIRVCEEGVFDQHIWSNFDSYDIFVLSSAFSFFRERYRQEWLTYLYNQTVRFFEGSKVERLVVNSDNTPTARMFCLAARSSGIHTDYLPHGVVLEDLSLQTGTRCGVDRILAWSSGSAIAYKRLGRTAEVVTHPLNTGSVAAKRPFPSSLSELRVLIMPPEWVGLSSCSRPDCFECDVLDSLAALSELGIRKASIKLHNSIPIVLEAKYQALEAIRSFTNIELTLIDSRIASTELYEKFDLVIIGPTTGLLEVSRSATPFIAFRSLEKKIAIFSESLLPTAYTTEELLWQITNYDFSEVERQSEILASSLRVGKDPFSSEMSS